MTGLPPAVRENPPIPFVSKAKKVENLDEAVNKTEHIKLELFMDPSNPASKYFKTLHDLQGWWSRRLDQVADWVP